MMDLDSRTFFRLAERLVHYPGAIRGRAIEEHQRDTATAKVSRQKPKPPTTSTAPQRISLDKLGAETAAVPDTGTSYLAERLKGHTP